MDTPNAIDDILQKYAKVVRSNFKCSDIILFGSFARGTNSEESDIDVAVVLDEFKNRMDIQLELMRLRRNIDSRIEPHPFRQKDFNISNPLVDEILKYGKRVDIDKES